MSGSLPASQALPLIQQAESGGRNIQNYAYDSTHTASGYYQITNSTWQQYAGQAGVDTSQYPTAMSAPYEQQTAVATAIYNTQGAAPWASYNAPLRQSLANAGYSGNVGAYTGPLGTQSPSGGTYMSNGVLYNSDGSIATYDGAAPSAATVAPGASGTQGSTMPFGSNGNAAASAVSSGSSGLMAVVGEIATRSSVLLVGLALMCVALVWAMRSDVVRRVAA